MCMFILAIYNTKNIYLIYRPICVLIYIFVIVFYLIVLI